MGLNNDPSCPDPEAGFRDRALEPSIRAPVVAPVDAVATNSQTGHRFSVGAIEDRKK